MIIGWDNLIDFATLSASEVATLPAANVKHPHLSRKWHTPSGTTIASLIADMGASVTCSLLGTMGSNLTPTATWRLRGSDADSTVEVGEKFDSGSILAGVKHGYGAAYMAFTAAQARFWRIDYNDITLSSNLQIGRVFLGPSWAPSVNHSLDWGITPLDDSTVSYSYGRQSFADTRPQRRIVDFTLDFMSEAEAYGNAFTLARANGIVKDILVIPDISSSYLSEQAIWGSITQANAIREPRLGLFRQRFTVLERL